MELREKLANIQKELKAPKNQKNSFGGYSYRSAEDILEAAKPVCFRHSTALTLSDNIELIGDRFYVKATATLYDIDSEKEISTTAYAREPQTKKGTDESQITGGASSYARKYALNGLFNIDDTKDSDTNEYRQESKKKADLEDKRKADQDKKKVENIGVINSYVKKYGIDKVKPLFNGKTSQTMTYQDTLDILKRISEHEKQLREDDEEF